MDTFTIGWSRAWLTRVSGGNPLVRVSDRWEACAIALAVVVALLAMPFVAAVGTAVHDGQSKIYAEQAFHRHQVVAVASADSVPRLSPDSITYDTTLRWTYGEHSQTGTANLDERVSVGDQVGIWVDDEGRQVRPPGTPDQAVSDAITVAVFLWLVIDLVLWGAAIAVRRRLTRARYAAWDDELLSMGSDGGRAHR